MGDSKIRNLSCGLKYPLRETILHRIVQSIQRHAETCFEQAAFEWQRVVEDGIVGEIAHWRSCRSMLWDMDVLFLRCQCARCAIYGRTCLTVRLWSSGTDILWHVEFAEVLTELRCERACLRVVGLFICPALRGLSNSLGTSGQVSGMLKPKASSVANST